jgi:hypothetical protein
MNELLIVGFIILGLGFLLGYCFPFGRQAEPMKNKDSSQHDFHHRMCHGPVTDKEFLEHMIPHHQMAIDMGKQVSKYSDNPAILNLARNIVWTQQYEIWYMKLLLQSQPYYSPILRKCPRPKINEAKPIMPYYYPCLTEDWKTKGDCDPKFMKPCKKDSIVNNWRTQCPPYPVNFGPGTCDLGKVLFESKDKDFCVK